MDSQYEKIKKQRTFILFVFIVTGIFLASVTPFIVHKINSENATATKLKELLILSGEIIYLDEVLTMSARMYAFTSDRSWQLRYDQHVAILDEKMASAIAINDRIAENLKKTDEANQQLISIETNAFAFVDNGEAERAVEALTNATYVYFKQLYSTGVTESLQLAIAELEARQLLLANEVSRFKWLYTSSTIVFFLLLTLFLRYSRKSEALNKSLQTSLEEKLNASREIEKALLQANDAKNRFLANISHELKTPLHGIVGNLQLLESENLSTKGTKIRRLLSKSSNILNAKLSDILDIVELQSGDWTLRTERIDLNDVFVETVLEFSEQCTEKGLNFFHENSVSNPLKLGDTRRIKQLINNLLSNAVKFTHTGSITFKLSESSDESILIEVSDSGIGMQEEMLKGFITAFNQADLSKTKSFEGLGLGLTIVDAIVSKMRGDISFESAMGSGTRIFVTLPLKTASGLVCHDIRQQVGTEQVNDIQIVVAEDEYINREIIKDMLKELNADIIMATNGEEASEYVNSKTSIVLMDIQMPVMDGITATKLIKEKYSQIPVIAVTANVSANDIRNYDEAGFDSVLGKPVSKTQLLDTISIFVNNESQEARARNGLYVI